MAAPPSRPGISFLRDIISHGGADEELAVAGAGHGDDAILGIGAGADDRRVAEAAGALLVCRRGSCGGEMAMLSSATAPTVPITNEGGSGLTDAPVFFCCLLFARSACLRFFKSSTRSGVMK